MSTLHKAGAATELRCERRASRESGRGGQGIPGDALRGSTNAMCPASDLRITLRCLLLCRLSLLRWSRGGIPYRAASSS